jgi:formylmethanofuran dehydrogenase subunit E
MGFLASGIINIDMSYLKKLIEETNGNLDKKFSREKAKEEESCSKCDKTIEKNDYAMKNKLGKWLCPSCYNEKKD